MIQSREILEQPSAAIVERLLEDLRQNCNSQAEFDEAVEYLRSANFRPYSRPKTGFIGLMPVGRLCSDFPVAPEGFKIPDYQRGYRWRRKDVELLLKDLTEFINEGEEKSGTGRPFYCLQPLVVKGDGSGPWEVVDGQQRLTTIFLILKYLNESPPFDLSYATREHSHKYLESFDGDPTDNIDFHHFYHAHAKIVEWFKDNEPEKVKFRELLTNTDPNGRNVRFIWYQLRDEDAPVEVFTRLNVGKIPLAEEELIRALFLHNPQGGQLAESSFQHRLALEWDRIETTLQNPAFWGFISRTEGVENGRIRLLFELCAPRNLVKSDHSLFHHYEGLLAKSSAENLREVWQSVVSCFEKLEEWWKDPETFHMVGFLTTILARDTTCEIRTLLEKSADDSFSKSAFKEHLRNKIRADLIGENDKSPIDYIDGLNYRDSNALLPIRQTLALFNISTLLRTEGVDFRFPFDLYHINRWDIEHVSSQAGENLNRTDDQNEWLGLCESELKHDHTAGDQEAGLLLEQIMRFREKANDSLSFEDLKNKVLVYFEETDVHEGLHGVGNLTLLDAGTNRAYKNAPFAVKRATILKNEKQGTFILPCTRDLFLKVFSNKPGNLRRWRIGDDGGAHRKAICQALEEFFSEKGER